MVVTDPLQLFTASLMFSLVGSIDNKSLKGLSTKNKDRSKVVPMDKYCFCVYSF
jgi:hypothetical protein